jgi:hypothetical protein
VVVAIEFRKAIASRMARVIGLGVPAKTYR